MENRMKISVNSMFTRSNQHWCLHAVFAAFCYLEKPDFFSYINYNSYFEKCQVKFLFFLKFFLNLKRRLV